MNHKMEGGQKVDMCSDIRYIVYGLRYTIDDIRVTDYDIRTKIDE